MDDERPKWLKLLTDQPGWVRGTLHPITGWWQHADETEPNWRHPEIAPAPGSSQRGPLRLLSYEWEAAYPVLAEDVLKTSDWVYSLDLAGHPVKVFWGEGEISVMRVCERCGSLVADDLKHQEWHRTLSLPSS